MQITVGVVLNEGESLSVSAEEAAKKTLKALGGNPKSDSCSVSVTQSAFAQTGAIPQPLTPGPSAPVA
jgi:hypothetical protein